MFKTLLIKTGEKVIYLLFKVFYENKDLNRKQEKKDEAKMQVNELKIRWVDYEKP